MTASSHEDFWKLAISTLSPIIFWCTISRMIFGRTGGALAGDFSKEYDNALATRDCRSCSMVQNLRHDDRVSVEREANFAAYIGRASTARTIVGHLDGYKWEAVCNNSNPEYLNRASNDGNFARFPDGALGITELPPATLKLVTVVSLRLLKRTFELYHSLLKRLPGFEEIREYTRTADSFLGWLDGEMGLPDQRSFLLRVLKAINFCNDPSNRHHRKPIWATPSPTFWKVTAGQGPHRWAQIVGVPPYFARDWLMCLEYPAAKAGTLLRPTQLDAGEFPEHFPSPKFAQSKLGGCAMDIGAPPNISLVREFLHEPIEFLDDYLTAWAEATVSPRQLKDARADHYTKLERAFGSTRLMPWMGRPNPWA